MKPEEKARRDINRQLEAAGWAVQSRDGANLGAARGIAVEEFPLTTGLADYMLFVDRRPIGVVEAKPAGMTLSGVEAQTARYSEGLPPLLKSKTWHSPLPFLYQSTGVETFFTDIRDPDPRSRRVFTFHRPERLAEWAEQPQTLRARLRQAVLKQAFEGRLVPQHPDDEPALVLLERIRAQREARTPARGKQKAKQMRLPTV